MLDIRDKLITITDEIVKLPNIEGNFKKYRINIEHLKFNPFNDRFAVEISEASQLDGKVVGYDEDSQKSLEKLLWESNVAKNKLTMQNMIDNGILRDVVIDLSGTILDGNRRIAISKMILKKNANDVNLVRKFTHVEVVLVEKHLTEKEIRSFETQLQMSEDEKLDYDPINVYLKVNRLFNESSFEKKEDKIKEIARQMGAKYKASDIQKKLDVFKVMESYLFKLKKNGQWSLLKDRADMFEKLHAMKQNWDEGKIQTEYVRTFPNYQKLYDILVIFVALKLEGKKFREIVPGIKNTLKSPLSTNAGIASYDELLKTDGVYEMYTKYLSSLEIDDAAQEAMKKVISLASKRMENSGKSLDVESAVNSIHSSSDKIADWIQKKGIVTLSPSQKEEMIKEIDKSIEILVKAKKGLMN